MQFIYSPSYRLPDTFAALYTSLMSAWRRTQHTTVGARIQSRLEELHAHFPESVAGQTDRKTDRLRIRTHI